MNLRISKKDTVNWKQDATDASEANNNMARNIKRLETSVQPFPVPAAAPLNNSPEREFSSQQGVNRKRSRVNKKHGGG